MLGCIALGAVYFSKLPRKKAACEVFSDLQVDGQGLSRSYSLHGMESFWYVLMCLGFGAGYFAKVSAKKALWELVSMVQAAPAEYAGAIGRALCGSAEPYQDWLQAWHEQPQQRLADAVAVLMGVDDIAACLGQITQPALIVHGEADQPIPLPLGQMFRDGLPGALDLIAIPGAGHTPSLTHPDQVNGPLAAFLRQRA